MPPDECDGLALRWLRYAAQKCDRIPDNGELRRLINWAAASNGSHTTASPMTANHARKAVGSSFVGPPGHRHRQTSRNHHLGPNREELRRCHRCAARGARNARPRTLLDHWAEYAGVADPWVCHGSNERFWTRRLSEMRQWAHCHAQIVPSPMRGPIWADYRGTPKEHSLDGTGRRLFLVIELISPLSLPPRKPTIWAPLIKSCEGKGRASST